MIWIIGFVGWDKKRKYLLKITPTLGFFNRLAYESLCQKEVLGNTLGFLSHSLGLCLPNLSDSACAHENARENSNYKRQQAKDRKTEYFLGNWFKLVWVDQHALCTQFLPKPAIL